MRFYHVEMLNIVIIDILGSSLRVKTHAFGEIVLVKN
mgnify:CR=1 FL=1